MPTAKEYTNNIRSILDYAKSPCDYEFEYDLSHVVLESVEVNQHGIEDFILSENPSDRPSIDRSENQERMKVLNDNELQCIRNALIHLDHLKYDNELTLGTIQASVGRAVQSALSKTVTMGVTEDNDLMTRSNSDIAKLVIQKIGEELREYF